jgi:N4-gp56 family major capsid protein
MAGQVDSNPLGTAAAAAAPPTVTDTMWRGVANFEQTVTALVMRDTLDLAREQLRWLQPGAYRSGSIVPGTNLIRYIAYGDLPNDVDAAKTKVEGEPNDPVDFAIGYDQFGATQYQRGVRITDVAMELNPHNLAAQGSEKVARNMLETMDLIVADTVVKSAGAAGGLPVLAAAGTGLVAADLRKAVTYLKKRNIPAFADGFYRAMVSPEAVYDLMSDTSLGGWIEVSKYAANTQLLNGEIGRMYGVRFIETNVGLADVGGAGKFGSLFFGPDYFAWGDLQTARAYFVSAGGDHADPAAQSTLMYWKAMFGCHLMGVATTLALADSPSQVMPRAVIMTSGTGYDETVTP